MQYKCGKEVILGDIIERVDPSSSLDVGSEYEVDRILPRIGEIGVSGVNSTSYIPAYFKLIKRKESGMLQRDKEYGVKLTGEDIAKLYLITGNTFGMIRAYETFSELLGAKGESMYVELPSIRLSAAIGYEDAMMKLLATSETEDQRKLRELKEKHAELGKAIEAMEKNND